MDARNRPLPEWFNRIRSGQIRLPRFQRFEAWSHGEVSALLETVLRGLPAGAALILEVGDEQPFVSRPMATAPEPTERANEHLLDGQQRLTALWRAFHDNFENRTYLVREIAPEGDEEQGTWEVVGQARWWRKDVRYPVWVDQPTSVHDRGYLPLRLLRPGDISNEIGEWCDLAEPDAAASRTLERRIHALRERVTSYNLPFLALPVTTPKDVALDVFIKLNTSSVRLSAFDIVVAQLEEATGESLHDLVAQLHGSVPDADRYRDVGGWVLDTAALREDRAPNQQSYQRLDLERVNKEWEQLEHGLAFAIETLRDERVFDGERLPTVAVLPILAALAEHIPRDPDAAGAARILLRKYLWRAFLTRRYDQAAAGRSLQDFRGLRDALRSGNGDVSAIPIFDDELFPLPEVDDLIRAGWPKNKEILARGILAMSIRTGARDLADHQEATASNVRKREYHHLFPQAAFTRADVDAGRSFRALNCALVTWRTNRKISAKAPLTYLRERAEAGNVDETTIRNRLKTHGIPYDELAVHWGDHTNPDEHQKAVEADYDVFLEARARVMHGLALQLASGLDPDLDAVLAGLA